MQTQQAIEPTIIDPEAVADFYRRRPVAEALTSRMVQIAQEEFVEVVGITLEAVRDPEEDSEWIRVTVTARLTGDELRSAYHRCLKRSLAEVPSDSWHLVVLQRRGA